MRFCRSIAAASPGLPVYLPVAILLLLTGACSAGRGATPLDQGVALSEVGGPQTWGAATNVVQVKRLYLSEQPDKASIEKAKSAGVGIVINLREDREMTWDEAAAVEDAGLIYYQVPVASEGASLPAAAMRRISELVNQHPDQRIWLHCSSGNRASAWLAVHLVQDHGMTTDSAIALAAKTGLTKPALEQRTRHFLETGS